MSQSGIPIVSQIGQVGAGLGNVVGGALGIGSGNSSTAPTPTAAPTIASPSDPDTSAAMAAAADEKEKDEEEHGAASTDLTGGSGLSGSPTVSRAVLLGS